MSGSLATSYRYRYYEHVSETVDFCLIDRFDIHKDHGMILYTLATDVISI